MSAVPAIPASSGVTLKPRQVEAYRAIGEAWRQGLHKQLVAIPTGVGKTVLAAWVATRPRWRRALFLVPREELLKQTVDTFERIDPWLTIGMLWGKRHEIDCRVVVGMMQTAHARLSRLPANHFDLVIVDECFPSGTLVDGRPIENLRVGDWVTAFDPSSGTLDLRRVARTFVRPAPDVLVRIVCGSAEVVCTGNHPLWTTQGWVCARDICVGDEIARAPGDICVNNSALCSVRQDATGFLPVKDAALQAVSGSITPTARHSHLYPVREPRRGRRRRAAQMEALWPGLLLRDLHKGMVSQSVKCSNGPDQPGARECSYGGAQSHAGCRDAGEGFADTARAAPSAASASRERSRSNRTAGASSNGARLADGGGDPDQDPQGPWLPNGLQSGHCAPRTDDRDRGGRSVAQGLVSPERGPGEGSLPGWARVDRVEILERGRDAEYGRLCPGDQVYNLEVDGLHTYTANGFVVHNCHHATAKTWREVLDHLQCDLRLGLSATPERADGAPLSNLFDDVTYRMSVADAVHEGYLCHPVGLQVLTGVDLDAVKVTAGDLNERQLDEAIDITERNHLVARTTVEEATGRRCIAFCVTIEHSRQLAGAMTELGLRADWVSGADGDRAAKIEKLRSGRLDVLCNAMLLTEGFDCPAVDCILMARPTKSRALYTQAVGRGLRLHPGKDNCLIIDFVDNSSRHTLAGVWSFWGQEGRVKPGERVDLSDSAATAAAERDAGASRQMELICGVPLDLPSWTREVDLLAPPPDVSTLSYGQQRWHYDTATEKQLAALARVGYDVAGSDWTKGQASAMLEQVPASAAQLKLLLALGFDALGQTWTRSQARSALDAAAEQGRTPDWGRLQRLGGRRGR